MLFIFSTPDLIRHLWQLKTIVFLHLYLICSVLFMSLYTGKPNLRGRLSTVDLLIMIGCFVKKKEIVLLRKAADLS